MFKVRFSKQSKKFIQNSNIKSKIKEVIDNLSKDPYFYPYKKLAGYDNTYRIRMGNFRLIYSVFKRELIIQIVYIGKRENIYDKFSK